MCLAIPMKIRKRQGNRAEVEAGGLIRTVNISLCPRSKAGEYVIVHAGFAIQKVNARQARETLKILSPG